METIVLRTERERLFLSEEERDNHFDSFFLRGETYHVHRDEISTLVLAFEEAVSQKGVYEHLPSLRKISISQAYKSLGESLENQRQGEVVQPIKGKKLRTEISRLALEQWITGNRIAFLSNPLSHNILSESPDLHLRKGSWSIPITNDLWTRGYFESWEPFIYSDVKDPSQT